MHPENEKLCERRAKEVRYCQNMVSLSAAQSPKPETGVSSLVFVSPSFTIMKPRFSEPGRRRNLDVRETNHFLAGGSCDTGERISESKKNAAPLRPHLTAALARSAARRTHTAKTAPSTRPLLVNSPHILNWRAAAASLPLALSATRRAVVR